MIETTQPSHNPATPVYADRKPGGKIPSTVAFAVGILLFFLPFAEVKCNGAALVDNTGLGIAMGTEWRTSKSSIFGNDMFGNGSSTTKSKTQTKKQDPNVFAIAALALGVVALLLSFTNAKGGIMGAAVSGTLAAIALIGLAIDLTKKVKTNLGDTNSQNDFGKMEISLGFTVWFYLSLAAFLLAAFLSYRRR